MGREASFLQVNRLLIECAKGRKQKLGGLRLHTSACFDKFMISLLARAISVAKTKK